MLILVILFIVFFCLYKNGVICAGGNAGLSVKPQPIQNNSTFIDEKDNGSIGHLKNWRSENDFKNINESLKKDSNPFIDLWKI